MSGLKVSCFNLAIEMLFISGDKDAWIPVDTLHVSISQSRCFSFQVEEHPISINSVVSFNLAIEMLFISGLMILKIYNPQETVKFQSRNRDAFHFRSSAGYLKSESQCEFQSRNRDAFHFRRLAFRIARRRRDAVSISQSRGFSFQVPALDDDND